MAAVGAVQVHCPECDVALPIAMVLKSPTREGDKLIVNVEPDLTDAVAHVWTHEPAE
ncbi:hypothetical protein SUDANB1_07186 [Streptomyces sp. enrichment culture]|uniref:hypothetical protein n=1 Tax=Streptomyces sp. enrichment culture TaxID=1795815 RepID=UPI003F563808